MMEQIFYQATGWPILAIVVFGLVWYFRRKTNAPAHGHPPAAAPAAAAPSAPSAVVPVAPVAPAAPVVPATPPSTP